VFCWEFWSPQIAIGKRTRREEGGREQEKTRGGKSGAASYRRLCLLVITLIDASSRRPSSVAATPSSTHRLTSSRPCCVCIQRVYVAPSTVPNAGLGLFAGERILGHSGEPEFVMEYVGEVCLCSLA